MKLAIGTALLVLLAGTTMYAQEQDKDKPAPQGEKKQEEKKQEPSAKEHEQPKAQEQQKTQDQQKAQHQAQEQQKDQAKQTEKEKSDAAKQQQQAAHQQQQVAKQQQQQVARQDHGQNPQAQREGGNARRISEQEFHTHFGREHTFRVTRSDDRRFNYGGYYWVYSDPWPSDWAYTDAVYVDEIDGEYYLIDPVHPGVRLMIVIAD
jgi:outer membrane biosynthesis protein TonB